MAKDKEEKEEMFSTNIRMPKHLANKILILAKSDGASLNSYMVNSLLDHVRDFERMIVEAYGQENFFSTQKDIFGEENPPYLKFEQLSFDFEQIKSTIKDIKRGVQRSPIKYDMVERVTEKLTNDAEGANGE